MVGIWRRIVLELLSSEGSLGFKISFLRFGGFKLATGSRTLLANRDLIMLFYKSPEASRTLSQIGRLAKVCTRYNSRTHLKGMHHE